MKNRFELTVHEAVEDIDRTSYNRIVDRDNPFLEYEFLEALEKSGCVGAHTNWHPRHLTLLDNGRIIGAITFYVKFDSYGEYIFDWQWADAFNRAGLSYYPKVVVAVPFTPANGRRILVHPDYPFEVCAEVMVRRLIDFCADHNCSSVHFLFLTGKEQVFLESLGFLSRKTHQYHWRNREYETFSDFMSDLRSKRKNTIRRERRYIDEYGIQVEILGKDEIDERHIDAMWDFYVDTHSRKWGSAYLNKEFFRLIFENQRDRLVMVMAKDRGKWIGGTFNFVKGERLFGRYWGTTANYDYLHFECCFYSLIEYAIEKGIRVFEAGAQGEHKFHRGFAAVPVYSSHFILHEGANVAISDYLEREREHTSNLIEEYNSKSPLKYLYKKGKAN